MGRTAEASQMIAQAKRLNPIHPDWYDWVLGVAAFHDGRYEDALAAYSRFTDPPPLLRRDIVAVNVRLGRLEEARKLAQGIAREWPEYRLATENLRPFRKSGPAARTDLRPAAGRTAGLIGVGMKGQKDRIEGDAT